MILRCTIDGLLLPGAIEGDPPRLVATDDDESFVMEAVEASYYELVSASLEEMRQLQRARYRLLRFADDFALAEGPATRH